MRGASSSRRRLLNHTRSVDMPELMTRISADLELMAPRYIATTALPRSAHRSRSGRKVNSRVGGKGSRRRFWMQEKVQVTRRQETSNRRPWNLSALAIALLGPGDAAQRGWRGCWLRHGGGDEASRLRRLLRAPRHANRAGGHVSAGSNAIVRRLTADAVTMRSHRRHDSHAMHRARQRGVIMARCYRLLLPMRR